MARESQTVFVPALLFEVCGYEGGRGQVPCSPSQVVGIDLGYALGVELVGDPLVKRAVWVPGGREDYLVALSSSGGLYTQNFASVGPCGPGNRDLLRYRRS